MEEIDDEILQDLYTWVDHIPLSRPKRNMARDFSDGVMCAEVLCHHFPKLVEIHNYVPASSTKQKEENWRLLNRKVLRKLSMELSDDVIRSLATARPYTIERVLLILRSKIDRTIFEKQRHQDTSLQYSNRDRPEVDQHSQRTAGVTPGRQQKTKGSQAPGESQSQTHVTARARSRSPAPGRPPVGKQTPREITKPQPPIPKKILPKPPCPPQRRPPPPKKPTRGVSLRGAPSLRESPPKIPMHLSPPRIEISPPKPGRPRAQTLEARANVTAREAKEFTSDYMSRLSYEEKAQECLAKDETIEILNAKVRRLEHLVHLKDIRIEDLQARLEELRPTNKRH